MTLGRTFHRERIIDGDLRILFAMTGVHDGPWIVRSTPRPDARLRLLCLPCAGGAASAYRAFGTALPEVDVMAIQLPGRENRLREPPLRSLATMTEHIARAIADDLPAPFAFYGHSMGTLLALELAKHRTVSPPVLLIMDGRHPPNRPARGPVHHLMSDNRLLAELARLGGTPSRVLEDRALMSLFLPALRADFEAVETWSGGEMSRVECPIAAIRGADDPRLDDDDLSAWGELTTARTTIHVQTGGHFHHQEHPVAFFALLRSILAPWISD